MNTPKVQLIHAARIAAKYLPIASADLMNELANRFDVASAGLSEALKQNSYLIAENDRLKAELEAAKNG